MPYNGRYGDLDYTRWGKGSFLFGVALFVIGAGGEIALALTHQDVPGWVHTLLLDFEILGILTALLLPIVFLIVMPLTE